MCAQPVPIAPAAATPLADLVPRYALYLTGESRRAKGRARYLWGITDFIRWLEQRLKRPARLSDLDTACVRRYKEYMGSKAAANTTITNALSIVRDFSLFCINEGLRTDDPTTGIKRPPKRRPDPNPLDADMVERLLDAMRLPPDMTNPRKVWHWERNQRAILLFLYTGLRLSEVAALRWAHIRFARGVILVQDGKGGKDRSVPIHPVLRDMLQLVPPEAREAELPVIGKLARGGVLMPITDACIEHIFSRWLVDRMQTIALTEHVHPHRMRHTFASLLVWNNVDLRTLQELLGHSSLSTTEYYVKVKDSHRRAAIACLPTFVVPEPAPTTPKVGTNWSQTHRKESPDEA